MEKAPFFAEIAKGPDGAQAFWRTASDGVKVRVAAWTKDAAAGTVLLFPGRTEYVEKYGPAAADLADRGFATIAIDWRGQGLADRLLDDRSIGHVNKFTDFQLDVAELIATATELDMPKPWFLLAHSMGGAIGLRALMDGLEVKAAAFTGPMFGIDLNLPLRMFAHSLAWSSGKIGLGHVLSPSTKRDNYVMVEPYEKNKLTTDRAMYEFMREQGRAHPELLLGGPSLTWLHEGLVDTLDLSRKLSPDVPAICFMGSNERIVDWARVRDRMSRWPKGKLQILDGGEHEVMMERPEIRKALFDQAADLFRLNANGNRGHGSADTAKSA